MPRTTFLKPRPRSRSNGNGRGDLSDLHFEFAEEHREFIEETAEATCGSMD